MLSFYNQAFFLPTSALSGCIQIPVERSQALKLTVFKKHMADYQRDISRYTQRDTALNVPNKNNALHTFSCWQRLAHVV